jgi:hypothetical protein
VQRAATLLAESRRLLQAAYPPQQPSDAWRYAILSTVDAELMARQGDAATARSTLVAALPVIEKRFGPTGFQSLLAQRRLQFVEAQAPLSAKTR